MHRSIFSLALLLGATLPALSFAVDSALQVNDPYVRLAPPSAPASAAFMVISNSGSADRKLIKAESPAAKTVELHSHISENGVMKMRQVPGIDIKANARAELKPGSYHIMLIDMKQALKEGEVIPITLSFDDGSKMQINAPVRKQTTMPADKAMDHQGMKH
ncbi:copper chaperone PCu(A)C [Propionivibrio sp.]|uniref:copper chaperone PCu(A)C n=1 Tax=Propionivibrio sp. TaxID=2212460 RepID=UPI0026068458|nr:copper chaperone PCu(A)C [Propionivibrio sp.]